MNILTLQIILFIILVVFSYFLISLFYEKKIASKLSKFFKEKNEKYYEEILRYQNKNKKMIITTKINLFFKINLLIEKAGLKVGLLLNAYTVITASILSFAICYFAVFSVFRIFLLSIIISLPAIFIPKAILSTMAELKNNSIEKAMLDFILQLKNYTQISNDIVYAFKQVKTIEPLQGYINKFLIEINSGIKFERAIENIKEKINFEVLRSFFSNLEHCYIYGGDYKELMEKSYKMISKLQKEKNARKQETKSARVVLGILIALDLIVYFNFIKNNYENYRIMTTSLLGIVILYWNFISIWILLVLMNNVKKLDY